MSAIDDVLDLILCDNAADYRSLPIIVGANQSARAIVQFQGRISQYIGHPKWNELRANGANNDRLWCGPLDDKTANHHIVACLHKAASADVAEHGRWRWRCRGCRCRHGSRTRRWRRINHRDGAYHVAASTVRSAVVRKRSGTVERASEGRPRVMNSRIPDTVWQPRGT